MKLHKLIFILFLITFLASSVNALGVSPAGKTIDFQPGEIVEIPLRIINTNNNDLSVSLNYRTETDALIEFNNSQLFISSYEDSKSAIVKITLPQDVEMGDNFIDIIVREETIGTGNINVIPSVVSRINIKKPIEGLYARALISLMRNNPELPIKFSMSIVNEGTQDINSARANLNFYNPQNEQVGSVESETLEVLIGSERRTEIEWSAPTIGNYNLEGILYYDGEEILLERNFQVGKKDVEITNLQINNYRLGDVINLEMTIKNLWNEQLDQVIIRGEVFENNTIVSEFTSPTLPVQQEETFDLFWNTEGLEEKEYLLKLMFYLDEEIKTQEHIVTLGLNTITFEPDIIFREEAEEQTIIWLIAIILLIILANVFIYVYILKNVKK